MKLIEGKDFTKDWQGGFACTKCAYSVIKSRMYNMKVHILNIHYGQRMFECDDCPQAFTQNGHKKRHMESAHKPQDFTCVKCVNGVFNRYVVN